jgi:hypothetical protein
MTTVRRVLCLACASPYLVERNRLELLGRIALELSEGVRGGPVWVGGVFRVGTAFPADLVYAQTS